MTTLLTPQEAAGKLAISYKQLLALTKAGQIRYVNVGNGLEREWRRYTEEDLQEFIERRTRQECQFIGSGTANRTATTSNLRAIDLRARRNAKISEKLKSLRPPKNDE